MHKTLNIKADGLQEQKTIPGSTTFSQEQKSKPALGTGSQILDSLRLEKDQVMFSNLPLAMIPSVETLFREKVHLHVSVC